MTVENPFIEVIARRSVMVGTSVHLWWAGWFLRRGLRGGACVMIRRDGSSRYLHVPRSPPTLRREDSQHAIVLWRLGLLFNDGGERGRDWEQCGEGQARCDKAVEGSGGREQSHVHARKKLIHAQKKSMPKKSQTAS